MKLFVNALVTFTNKYHYYYYFNNKKMIL